MNKMIVDDEDNKDTSMENKIKYKVSKCSCSSKYEEKWKEINPSSFTSKGFDLPKRRYYISNHGQVVSVKYTKTKGQTFHVMKTPPDPKGYEAVCFSDAKLRVTGTLVHILVMFHFQGPPPSPEHQVDKTHLSKDPEEKEMAEDPVIG